MSETILNGTIISAEDHSAETIFGGLPLKPRHQTVTIRIDENFWPILFMKGKRIKLSVEGALAQSGLNTCQVESNQIKKAES